MAQSFTGMITTTQSVPWSTPDSWWPFGQGPHWITGASYLGFILNIRAIGWLAPFVDLLVRSGYSGYLVPAAWGLDCHFIAPFVVPNPFHLSNSIRLDPPILALVRMLLPFKPSAQPHWRVTQDCHQRQENSTTADTSMRGHSCASPDSSGALPLDPW